MAITDQPVTTFSDTGAQGRVISDFIFNIDPMDTPVVAHFGLDSANQKFRLQQTAQGKQVKIELIEDTNQQLTTTIANSTTLTTSTLTFTVTDASVLQDGFIIQVDSELMVVSAVNTSSNVITVDSRAYGGTNATHKSTQTITIVGMARKQGDDADYVGLTQVSVPYNYTSIEQKGIQVTGTEDVIGQFGKSGEYNYQMNKVIPELSRWVERQFFYSIRRQGSASVAPSMGGIATYVTTNSSSITTTLTKAAIESVALKVMQNGGNIDVGALPLTGAQSLYDLMDTSSFVRITLENTMFGMRPIARINTQFFTDIMILASRHCPPKKAWFLDTAKVGFYTFRPFAEYPIARSGDSKKGEVIGEHSLLVANGSLGHGYVVTTSANL